MTTKDNHKTEETTFRFIPNGPIHVSGAFVLKNSQGEIRETNKDIWLCSCGQSSNKPYCDGSHKKK